MGVRKMLSHCCFWWLCMFGWLSVQNARQLATADNGLERQIGYAEFCEAETFEPKCREHSEVVVMQAAFYGRQVVGRCVRTDYGYVGCKVDVLQHLDMECSGRRTCQVSIPDKELDNSKKQLRDGKCPDEFRTYLNASYSCVTVDSSPCLSCGGAGGAAVLRAARGYVASVLTAESSGAGAGCGSARCPWRIEVDPGLKINITLIDFSLEFQGSRQYSMPDTCFRYAVVKESLQGPKSTPICGGKARRSHVYTSVSNTAEIHIVSPEVFQQKGQFILYYEAVGCADKPPPKNTWLNRTDDRLVVGCRATGERWTLTCRGGAWQGEVGTCPEDLTGENLGRDLEGVIALPLGVLIAVVVGIALVIGVLILTVGVVCLKRQQQDLSHPGDSAIYIRAPQDMAGYHDDLYLTAKSHPYRAQQLDTIRKYKAAPVGAAFPPGSSHRVPGTGAGLPPLGGANVPPSQHGNIYNRKMKQRPLPSIPNIPAAAAASAASEKSTTSTSDDGPIAVAQIHRTNSQASSSVGGGTPAQVAPGHYTGVAPQYTGAPTMVAPARQGRPRTASARSSDTDPQYFVLDPDELSVEEEEEEGEEEGGEGEDATAGRGGKSPEEENAENADKETTSSGTTSGSGHLNNSCHEIPLRPSRETPHNVRGGAGANAGSESNNTGNTSWP